MGSNWTNAGRTVADGGIFTTLDLNGGSIDGTTIGAAAQSSVKATTLSGSGQGDVVGQFTVHGLTALSGAVDLRGVADTALAVANDSFYYLDVSDNLVKRDSMADYAAAIAGSGLAATAGVLSVDLNEAGAGVVDVAADSFTFIDANDSNAVKKDSYADYAAAIAGDGLKATAGVLSYDASELRKRLSMTSLIFSLVLVCLLLLQLWLLTLTSWLLLLSMWPLIASLSSTLTTVMALRRKALLTL